MLGTEAFIEASEPWLPAGYDREALRRLAPDVQQRVKTLAEVPAMVDFLFVAEPEMDGASWEKAVSGNDMARSVLTAARDVFSDLRWEAPAIEEAVKALAERLDLKVPKAQAPIRVAVTGRTVGPPLWLSLEVLGRDSALARIDVALRRLG